MVTLDELIEKLQQIKKDELDGDGDVNVFVQIEPYAIRTFDFEKVVVKHPEVDKDGFQFRAGKLCLIGRRD